MDVKEILLKKLDENRVLDICNFVEELYLMDCDLLILMARKFFNLFCVFHEINCQKYERLGIPFQSRKIIVTNRALPLLRNDLRNHRFSRIVIADDIIIHGRSIREVYDEVISLCPDAKVALVSYMRNDQDKFAYEDIMEKIYSRYQAESYGEWRNLSDETVKAFFMAGRPYISYLPYFSLKIDWKELMDKLQGEECMPVQDDDMNMCEVEACMYTGVELQMFQQMDFCKITAIRFYHYSTAGLVIAVPYFLMDEMENDSLTRLSDVVRKDYLAKPYQKLVLQNNGADEMRMRELEYTLSTWLCMYVFDILGIPSQLDKEIEQYNFCGMLLPETSLSAEEVKERVDVLKAFGRKGGLKDISVNDDIRILLGEYEKLKDLYKRNYPNWCSMTLWTGKKIEYQQRLMDHYLVLNGEIDEERCKNNNVKQKRLLGVPVRYFLDDMADFLYEISGQKEDKRNCMKQVFAAILRAIDSGKGTVVTKMVDNGHNVRYMESVIYAGEQNYKFYENTNFPFMYGIYLIEQESGRQSEYKKIDARKKLMTDHFADYLKQNNIFYIKEEMLQIARNDIAENYKEFLQASYKKYAANPVLKEAVTMAFRICNYADQ